MPKFWRLSTVFQKRFPGIERRLKVSQVFSLLFAFSFELHCRTVSIVAVIWIRFEVFRRLAGTLEFLVLREPGILFGVN